MRRALEVALPMAFSATPLLFLLFFLPVTTLATAVPALRDTLEIAAVAAAAATLPPIVFLALPAF